MQPVRHGPGEAFDICGQQRVEGQVVSRVVPHHVDDRSPGPPGVVEIGQAIGETGPRVEQRRGGFGRHPAVAVGGPGHDTFGKAQDAAHLRPAIERGDEMHLRGARIGETDVDAVGQQSIAKVIGAVHVGVLNRSKDLGK